MLGVLVIAIRQEKRYMYWKGRYKMIIYRKHDCVGKKSKNSTDKLFINNK